MSDQIGQRSTKVWIEGIPDESGNTVIWLEPAPIVVKEDEDA